MRRSQYFTLPHLFLQTPPDSLGLRRTPVVTFLVTTGVWQSLQESAGVGHLICKTPIKHLYLCWHITSYLIYNSKSLFTRHKLPTNLHNTNSESVFIHNTSNLIYTHNKSVFTHHHHHNQYHPFLCHYHLLQHLQPFPSCPKHILFEEKA
jgi:hypothetical protein